MVKKVISERQGIVLVILFLLGSNAVLGTANQAKQDSWVKKQELLLIILHTTFG